MNKEIVSPFPYEEIMEAVSRVQGSRVAIVILEAPDGGTTYLRHNISEKDTVEVLKQAYDQRNIVGMHENPAEMDLK